MKMNVQIQIKLSWLVITIFTFSLLPQLTGATVRAQSNTPTPSPTTTPIDNEQLNAAMALYAAEDWQGALSAFEAALASFKTAADKPLIAESLFYIGQTQIKLEAPKAAQEDLTESAITWLELTDYQRAVETYRILGDLFVLIEDEDWTDPCTSSGEGMRSTPRL